MSKYELVQMGHRMHLVEPGTHRTACNRLVDKVKTWNPATSSFVWLERARKVGGGEPTCWVCRRIKQKTHNQYLDEQYGKVTTMENQRSRK